jgi:hypothetical protein
MASLPVEQFRAVLAHEFGHLARNHARFSNWIYRVRRTWYRLLTALEAQRSAASGLFIRFFNWYAPYFEAYSFVLARANEYVADAHSARVAGREHAGRALVSVYAKSNYAEAQLWDEFYRPARDRSEPPAAPFTCYLSELQTVAGAPLQDALKLALARKTDMHDTHPSLSDRLAALGESAHDVAPAAPAAAEALLGPLAQELAAEQDQAWRESIAKSWQERHQKWQEALQHKAGFEALAQERSLKPAEQVEYARSLDLLSEGAAALPLLEAAFEAEPAHARAWFLRGRIRLAAGNDDGVGDLSRAMELEEQATGSVCQLLYRHFERRAELQRFEPYEARYRAFEHKQAEATAERGSVDATDRYLSHGLEAQQVEQIAAAISKQEKLRRAWLARKQLEHFPENKLFVLILEGDGIDPVGQNTLESVASELPEGISAFLLSSAAKPPVLAKVRELADAEIYARPPR